MPGPGMTRDERAAVQAALDRRDFAHARRRCAAVLARDPGDAQAWRIDADICLHLGDFASALPSLEACARLRPSDAEVRFLLGAARQAVGDAPRAIESYRQAIALDAGLFAARANLAMLLRRQGDHAGAIEQLEAAIAAAPGQVDLVFNLGVALEHAGRHEDAMAAYRRVLDLQPRHAPSLCNLGVLLHRTGRLDAAGQALQRAVEVDPALVQARVSLSSVLKDLGLIEAARASAQAALLADPSNAMAASNHVLFGAYLPDDRPAASVAEEFRQLDAACRNGEPPRVLPRWTDGAARLRIGYVSADFRDHTVAYFIEPVLAAHDRTAVEVHCYDCSAIRDAISARLRTWPGITWHECAALDAQALAARIEADRIDVLVDLMGNTADNRLPLFARRAAPVQASWIGWPDSTGIAAMNYLVGDRHVFDPGRFDQPVTETPLALPDTWLCYQPDARAGEPRHPAQAVDGNDGSRTGLVLGSLNAVYKLNPPTLDAWAGIMARLPSSSLWLAGVPTGRARERVVAMLAAAGIDAARVKIDGPLSIEAFFAAHRSIDIALDPFPFNGGTTTFHSLWMGVPVVTLAGRRFAGRMGCSILRNLGLDALVAHDAAGYVDTVVALAGDAAFRTDLHRTLRARILASPLVDGPRQARAVEAAFRRVAGGDVPPAGDRMPPAA